MAENEKYQSTLEGAQIDDALQQMNLRIPEGWAEGTKDGEPVPSDSQFYHHNAKYWAEYAEYLVGRSDIFIARYGVTSGGQINSALSRNVPIIVFYPSDKTFYAYIGAVTISGTSKFVFASISRYYPGSTYAPPTVRYLACNTTGTAAGAWSVLADITMATLEDIEGKAPLASPHFTGVPTVPNIDPLSMYGDQVTNVQWVDNQVRDVEQTLTIAINGKANKSDLETVKAEALAAYVTDTAEGSIASFSDGADNIPVKALSATITPKQSGSGDPSPSNVRPISGWSVAEITRAGRNLYDEAFTGIGTGSTIKYFPLQVGANKTVVASTTTPLNGNSANMFFLSGKVNTGGSSGTNGVSVGVPRTATADENGYVTLGYRDYNDIDPRNYQTQVEYGTTPTAYKAYDGQTITLTFGSTVYAGTLEYIGNGQYKIQPTHEIVDMGNLTWTYNTTSSIFITSDVSGLYDPNGTLYCSAYKATTPAATNTAAHSKGNCTTCLRSGTTDRLYVRDDAYTDPAVFKVAVTGQTLLYPLATLPDPIIVSGSEVRSLLGDNNVWADTGSVSVEYRADTKLYIAKVIGGGNMALSMAAPINRTAILRDEEVEAPTDAPTESDDAPSDGEEVTTSEE